MFVDVSFFEVEEGTQRRFERDFGQIVSHAGQIAECISSELVKLEDGRTYAWVERWTNVEDHNAFNEVLFAQLLPELPDFGRYATRLVDRDVEGFVVSG